MRPSVQKQLFQYIDEHLLSYLNRWQEFATLLGQNSNSAKATTLLLEQLQCRGVSAVALKRERPFLFGELNTGAPRTLLFYHYYNPESCDLQYFASIATCLAALEAYQFLPGSLPVNLLWLLDGLSETGHWNGDDFVTRDYKQLLKQADGCLLYGKYSIGQTNTRLPLLALGTKGLLCVELETSTAPDALPSMYGAVVPNALWRLLWALNSVKSACEEILIEGFYDALFPAEDETIEQLRTLPDSASWLVQQCKIAQPLLGLQGFQLHYAQLLTPTCTINEISSMAPPAAPNFHTTIPGTARARLDFHLVPNQHPDDIFVKLQRHLQTQSFDDIKVRKLYATCPRYISITDSFTRKVIRATTAAYGHAPSILPLTTNSYSVDPLQQLLHLPVIITLPDYSSSGDHISDMRYRESFAASIKQVVMTIEELAHGTDPTE
ncbi:MAG TPA: peptidase dimerization domain-containing protein [Ktedonobacteraceae bacterium]|nr:peptidase dimerization domain-containing protein [Ktedonobacteraceae bacterium]